ncbi:uncharacterized protein LOC108114827 isoform X2 [Drosophila eugracilis]|nr:uncharacterized protein LOC108114827 isoform X2 [Drosophila eugracilis]XP_017081453.2 uncharacterized protein LOC108114827 isoform X2 [Drosophila eugracilis]XP_017081454.2 uncharacterized protein LOC108114827 isoform X2 [Drosophila eugracilis]
MSLRQTYAPNAMAQYPPQQQLPQKHQPPQRHHPMSLPQAYPAMTQQQQRQQHLQQQYYFAPLQTQMGPVFNTRPWLLYQNQQQPNPQFNYQCWYDRPQPVTIPPVVALNPNLHRIVPPVFYQQPNGSHVQPTAAPKPEGKAATKTRSPFPKEQTQPTAWQGRPMAGGRPNFRHEYSAGSESLNRNGSLASFDGEGGARSRDSEEEEMMKYRRIAARILSPESEELDRRQMHLKVHKGKPTQERKNTEAELDSSLGSGASSLFRRLAQFMRSRSHRKTKAKPPKSINNDEVSQISSVFSTPKKRGFLRRFFGEVRDPGTYDQRPTKSSCSVHYPTDLPLSNRDQEDLREAEYFKKLRKRQQRKQLGNINCTTTEK